MRISVLTSTIRPEYLDITQKSIEAQTFKDFEWLVEVGTNRSIFELPRKMNKMLARAKGEITVHLQDCIEIPPNFLEHVNNTYDGSFVTFPIVKDQKTWDWRKDRLGAIEPQEWEADLAVAPLKAFKDIGGYDEEYCYGWSFDNVEVAYRAQAAGYTFRCDNTIYGNAIDHDAIKPHPYRNTLPSNLRRATGTYHLAKLGEYKLDYL